MSQTRNSARPVSRPGQHPPFQFGILLRGEPGGATGDLAIAQPGNALGIVSLHRPGQIPRRQANQFRRFLTAAPVQDVGNAKQATHHLPGLLQPSQQPQTLRVAVLPHRDHRRSPPSDLSLRARHPKMLTQETTDLSRDPSNRGNALSIFIPNVIYIGAQAIKRCPIHMKRDSGFSAIVSKSVCDRSSIRRMTDITTKQMFLGDKVDTYLVTIVQGLSQVTLIH